MGLTVAAAMLAGGTPPGQDRWGTSEQGAVVLDGASSHSPEAPAADAYVDALLAALLARLDHGDLRDVLREAIAETAHDLGLTPGNAPSSTVLLLRVGEETVEVAALGDSTAVVGLLDGEIIRVSDDRLQHIGVEGRHAYREHLRKGSGFGAAHRERLKDLQRSEWPHRNRPGGYWIAEAEPAASDELVIQRFPRGGVAWVVLATDGIQKHIDRIDPAWPRVAAMDEAAITDLLHIAQSWENDEDPDGVELPRSKRHDDKTLLVWRS